jgi:HKD family nuclease
VAKNEFILQGFTDRTHGDAVRELFNVVDIQKVIFSVAFINESGVEQISEMLNQYSDRASVYAGIRNDITSHQGLSALLDTGVELFTVDTGSRAILFHPKLYFVQGAAQARLVIGSANLTPGGLNNNIEAGLLVDFDLDVASDKRVVERIIAEFTKLSRDYPEHITRIQSLLDLNEMLKRGRLVDENQVSFARLVANNVTPLDDSLSRIKLRTKQFRRMSVKATISASHMAPTVGISSGQGPTVQSNASTIGTQLNLVWESKPLTKRDLNIPKGSTTNKTGSMNLDKGLLTESIDQRHYFRDEVFASLSWALTNASGNVEETYAKFQLVIKSVDYGEFDLRIAHSTDTKSKTYRQNNAMTRLSWGPAKELVARPDLVGRTVKLYRETADPKRFVLDID